MSRNIIFIAFPLEQLEQLSSLDTKPLGTLFFDQQGYGENDFQLATCCGFYTMTGIFVGFLGLLTNRIENVFLINGKLLDILLYFFIPHNDRLILP